MEEYDVLIANNEKVIGQHLAKSLEKRKYSVLCCSDNSEVSRLCEENGGFPLVVLYNHSKDDSLQDTVKHFRQAYPQMKLVICDFTQSYESQHEFFKLGADRCIVMPYSPEKLAIIIKHTLSGSNYRNILTMLPEFLELNGFPADIKGFDYLVYAATVCIKSPSKLRKLVHGIYPEIAEHFGSEWKNVERSMRSLGQKAEKSGAFRNITKGAFTGRPTNYEMICGVCDAFCVYYGLHGNKRRNKWRNM